MSLTVRKVLLFLISFVILVSGCSLKLKTKEIVESEYRSVGNEMKVFGFGIGESMSNIVDVIGESGEKKETFHYFPGEDLKVYYQHNHSRFIATKNNEFAILDDIKVGMHREVLINDFPNLDLFEYTVEGREDPSIFLTAGNQKIVLNMKNNEVNEIILGKQDVSFAELLGLKSEGQDMYSDEELFSQSKFLSFKLDIGTNNEKLLSKEFLEYAKIGLIEGVPLPIGTSKYELSRRFGTPNYIFKGEDGKGSYYYYKRFNLYLGFDENERLKILKMPVNVKVEDFLKAQGLASAENQEFGQYSLSIYHENGVVSEVLITGKDLP
ncbi:hypothetical protein [Mesobacillus harenae]|uniref:hypothetical protein n=1 Tax=Mesobacillus harenae TaxID=2213203 RepID=UPI0015812C50|nr:hypothetical protein [Mesobacillus harenae]